MIVTLYGPDSYRRLQALGKIIEAYNKKSGNLARERFNLQDKDADYLLAEFLETQSIFSAKKLVILDEPFESKDKKGLKLTLKKYEESEDIIIVINTTKKYPPPFKFLEESPNKLEDFSLLKGTGLVSFIKNQGRLLGMEIDARQGQTIADAMGSDTWRITTELEQLALTKSKKVDRPDGGIKIDYFTNLNILKRSSAPGERLVALERLISGLREDPGRVFNGLAFRPVGVDEAIVYADYDIAVKSGKLEYEEVLTALAVGLRSI